MDESKESWWNKNPFCVSSKEIKDNNIPAHWVGHLKFISLDIDEFFKRTPNVDEKEAIVTGKTEKKTNAA